MRRRIYTQQKNTRIPTPELSTAPAQGMFQQRPFENPAPIVDAYQQPDLKTSLMQAQRYGHHLSQMHDTDVSPPQVMQPKRKKGRSMHSEPAQLASERVQPSSGDRSLPKTVRQKMEAAFSTDFSNVSIHQGAQAEAMGADAYAQGNQIHFQPGKYNPTSQSGQVAVPQGKGAPINSDPKLEKEADILGAKAAQGEQVQVAGAGSGIQRQATSQLGHNCAPVQLGCWPSKPSNSKKRLRSSSASQQSTSPESASPQAAAPQQSTSPESASPQAAAPQQSTSPESASPQAAGSSSTPDRRTEKQKEAARRLTARRLTRKWQDSKGRTSEPRKEAKAQGEAVRDQVRVQSVAPGIIHTRIHRPPENQLGGRPGEIMNHMGVGDTYDRLRVQQGAGNGGVRVTEQGAKQPSELASDLNANTAVINGGFFSMSTEKPVGPTMGTEDVKPIASAYRNDYSALNVDGQVGISSGPMLEPSNGDNMFEHDRFKYANNNKPQYKQSGALTHADNKNPRAAISTFPPTEEGHGDAIMHTLTTGSARRDGTHGATMKEWQNITTQGSYEYKPNSEKGEGNIKEDKTRRPDTLNLDGGGSVYMRIKRANGQLDKVASGVKTGKEPRPVPDIIFAGGQGNEGKEISIGNLPDEERR